MNIKDLNNLIQRINLTYADGKISRLQVETLLRISKDFDKTIFKEFRVSSWDQVGGKSFGNMGERAFNEFRRTFESMLPRPKQTVAPSPLTAKDIGIPLENIRKSPLSNKSEIPLISEITPSEPISISNSLSEIKPPCICPADDGTLQSWICPLHGTVKSTKTV
jgi:hypothetical protein